MGDMRHDSIEQGPTASAALVGTLVPEGPPGQLRERWGPVLDAMELMAANGWRVISGPNWVIRFEEAGEINVRVFPSQDAGSS